MSILPDEIPTSIKRMVYFFYNGKDKEFEVTFYDFSTWNQDRWGHYIKLSQMEMDFEFPELPLTKDDVYKKMLGHLNGKREALLAEHHVALKRIDDEIASLLCIEHEASEPFIIDAEILEEGEGR